MWPLIVGSTYQHEINQFLYSCFLEIELENITANNNTGEDSLAEKGVNG